MAKQIALNHTDTGVSGVTTLSLDRAILNYGADYRVKQQDASSAILTNMTAPADRPETFKVAVTPVKDVYKGSVIDSSYHDASRRGVSILCALNKVLTITDTVDATYRVDKPISAHIVLKLPYDDLITPATVEDIIGRLISGLYESGLDTTDRIASMMRGSLTPVDL